MSVIALPKILTDRLTEEGAKAFVEIIDKIEVNTQNTTLQIAAERFETRLAQVGTELCTKMAEMKSELHADMANLQVTIIKWVVGAAFTQIAVLLAMLAIFLK